MREFLSICFAILLLTGEEIFWDGTVSGDGFLS